MKKMNIFKYAVFAAALSAGFTSCSEDEFEQGTNSAQVVTVGGLNFQIGDYPSATLRSDVPGFREKDAKSAWAVNDEIKLILTCHNSEDNIKVYDVTLAYGEDGYWHNLSGNAVLETSSSNVLVDVSAAYGEHITWTKSESGREWAPQLTGTSEYFYNISTGNHASEPINIEFNREYSRIRLNVLPIENEDGEYEFEDVVVNFDGAKFLANGLQEVSSVTIPAELIQANFQNGVYSGNAYIYGAWDNGAKILVGERTFALPECTSGKSYGVNLNPVQAPAVEVDATTNTITLTEEATEEDITLDVVMQALGSTGTSLTVKGTITDEMVYRTILGYFEEVAGERGDDELMFDVDFSGVDGLTRLTAVAEYGYVKSLKLPTTIGEVGKGGLDAMFIEDLYVYNPNMITHPVVLTSKGKVKTQSSFFNTEECTLHLPASSAADFEEGDTEWGNATWSAIEFDAE